MAETTAVAAVTRDEAAAMYGVGVKVISAAIHSGGLKAKRIGKGKRQYRISVTDLAAWFDGLPNADEDA